MKPLLILVSSVVSLFACSSVSFAQSVTSIPKGNIYKIVSGFNSSNPELEEPGRILLTINEKPKRINKSTNLQVLAIANISRDFYYQGYVVEYKKGVYYLPSDQVVNNNYINNINEKLDCNYRQMQLELDNEIARVDNENSRLQHLKDSIGQIITDSLFYYTSSIEILKDKRDRDITDIKNQFDNLIKGSEDYIVDSLTKVDEAWRKSLPLSSQKVLNTISLTKSYLSSSNYVGGHDIILKYINHSDKVIKYLDWTGKVKNAVGDYVRFTVRDIYTFSGRDTGPVYQGEEGGGTWENMIYNWSAEEFIPTSVTITYMNGQKFSINGAGIKALIEDRKHHQADGILKDKTKYHLTVEERMVVHRRNLLEKQKKEALSKVYEAYNEKTNKYIEPLNFWKYREQCLIKEAYDEDPTIFSSLFRPSPNHISELSFQLEEFKKRNFLN